MSEYTPTTDEVREEYVYGASVPLPTSPGSVVRWSIRIDGTEHYGAALLDYDEDRPVWYMAGFDREHTPAELHTLLLRRDWREVTP